jgi:hypothetical protein
MDVAIVGVGLHPFGRFPERTGIDMGAIAIRRALADAGVAWRVIQFAFAGSYEIDNPDASRPGIDVGSRSRTLHPLRDRGERAAPPRTRSGLA